MKPYFPLNLEFAIVDIETTGGSPASSSMVEIGVVISDGQKVLETYQTLLNPGRHIPWNVTMIHGITDDMVVDAPRFEDVADELFDMLQNRVFVAHNASFDFGFVKKELQSVGYDFSPRKICSVRFARRLEKGLKSYSLKALASFYQVVNPRAHRALADAETTAEIFHRLLVKPDAELALKEFLNQKNRESTLPPNIDKQVLKGLPGKPGVYWFLNRQKQVIYVGKANDLRSRVISHFTKGTHTKEKIRFHENIYEVGFELAGNELMALLLENELIKKHYPIHNRLNKEFLLNYGLFSYTDQGGYERLMMGETGKWTNPLATFKSKSEAMHNLLKLSMQHGLCLKLNGIFDKDNKLCRYQGTQQQHCLVCEDQADATTYNKQVAQAIATLPQENYLLKTTGRTAEEVGMVWVEHGKIRACGYVETNTTWEPETLLPQLKTYYDTQDSQSILRQFLPKAIEVGSFANGLKLLEIVF